MKRSTSERKDSGYEDGRTSGGSVRKKSGTDSSAKASTLKSKLILRIFPLLIV